MAIQDHYDLLILGSGSTAFAAAIHAQELGKTAVMTEGRTLGGTCVNRGCLTSKNLIEAARLVYDAAHPRYPGLTPGRLGVDFPALIAQRMSSSVRTVISITTASLTTRMRQVSLPLRSCQ